jgi:sec-independent protein translocase protein TatB
VILLILESLGSTELLFILAMALVFFGPRKLPQISRSLGKNLAEFRRASEDFKRTWEREVSLEEYDILGDAPNPAAQPRENSIMNDERINRPLQPPTIEPVAGDRGVPRQPDKANPVTAIGNPDTQRTETPAKSDWL